MTSSNGNDFPLNWSFVRGIHRSAVVRGGFPSQRPVTWCFDVFFDLRVNKRLSKQSRRRWFETPSHSLWRHCNGYFHIWFRCYMLNYMKQYGLLHSGGDIRRTNEFLKIKTTESYHTVNTKLCQVDVFINTFWSTFHQRMIHNWRIHLQQVLIKAFVL